MQPYYMIGSYNTFTDFTPTIPKFYWDVTSQEQRIKAICVEIDKTVKYAETIGLQVDTNSKAIAELAAELENFSQNFADDFEVYYKERIEQWLNDNLVQKVGDIVKFVDFGLTPDGYFVAYIPETWDFLKFDTGADYANKDTYGHLIMEW